MAGEWVLVVQICSIAFGQGGLPHMSCKGDSVLEAESQAKCHEAGMKLWAGSSGRIVASCGQLRPMPEAEPEAPEAEEPEEELEGEPLKYDGEERGA